MTLLIGYANGMGSSLFGVGWRILVGIQPTDLFALRVGLTPPWKIVKVEFANDGVHIHVDFERGAKFDGLPVRDTAERVWRHLNIFRFLNYVHASVPRVAGPDGKVRAAWVPWAQPGSGFTLEFEAFAPELEGDCDRSGRCQEVELVVPFELASTMPVAGAARILEVGDTRLWRVVSNWVDRRRAELDLGQLRRVGVDETASRRGHDYVTVVVDLDARRVLYACEGRGSSALGQFKAFLIAKGLDSDAMEEFACDVSPAFLKGIKEAFPEAGATLDRYHLSALLSRAVDQTRKAETRKATPFKRTHWLWLKNTAKLSSSDRDKLQDLLKRDAFPLTDRASGLRLAFQEILKAPKHRAEGAPYRWIGIALASVIDAVVPVAVTFFNSADKALHRFETRLSNGLLDCLHSVLQASRNQARGYRNPHNLIAVSYLLHGKIDPATYTK